MDTPKGAPFKAMNPAVRAQPGRPYKDQKISLHAGGRIDGRVEGFEHMGTLCLPGKDGAIFITREQAKEFFGLVEPTA